MAELLYSFEVTSKELKQNIYICPPGIFWWQFYRFVNIFCICKSGREKGKVEGFIVSLLFSTAQGFSDYSTCLNRNRT